MNFMDPLHLQGDIKGFVIGVSSSHRQIRQIGNPWSSGWMLLCLWRVFFLAPPLNGEGDKKSLDSLSSSLYIRRLFLLPSILCELFIRPDDSFSGKFDVRPRIGGKLRPCSWRNDPSFNSSGLCECIRVTNSLSGMLMLPYRCVVFLRKLVS